MHEHFQVVRTHVAAQVESKIAETGKYIREVFNLRSVFCGVIFFSRWKIFTRLRQLEKSFDCEAITLIRGNSCQADNQDGGLVAVPNVLTY